MDLRNYDIEQIGSCLKKRRTFLGLTKEAVIDKLKKEQGIEMAISSLYKYESGKIMPSVKMFLALCNIYNIYDIRSFLDADITGSEENKYNMLTTPDKTFLSLYEYYECLNASGIAELKNFLNEITSDPAFIVKKMESEKQIF